MNGLDTPTEIMRTLCRRRELLRYLLEEPRDKCTIVDDLGVPRTTLDRAIRELETMDVVEYRDGAYGVTPFGEHLIGTFFGFLERVRLTLELEPFFDAVPPEAFDLDVRALADAKLLCPEADDPYAIVDEFVLRLDRADRVEGLLPYVGSYVHETAHERVVEHGAETEFVLAESAAQHVVSEGPLAPLTEEMLATGRSDLYVYDGTPPYWIGVFDDETVQIVVDDGGDHRALVETDRPAVREWARETVRNYRDRATELAQADLASPAEGRTGSERSPRTVVDPSRN